MAFSFGLLEIPAIRWHSCALARYLSGLLIGYSWWRQRILLFFACWRRHITNGLINSRLAFGLNTDGEAPAPVLSRDDINLAPAGLVLAGVLYFRAH